MELLWPEDDPGKTVKRLHVALASLRRTLEPDIRRGTPSAYIIRSGDAYRIAIGNGGRVDIEGFIDELKFAREEKDPEKAIEHYLNAASTYRGDFLEEDLYTPWCEEERERFRGEYLQLLEGLIEFYDDKKDYKKCIVYAKKYLTVDKYAEDVYQVLMTYYSRIGNKAMVSRTFNKCKDLITAELDCPLSEETEDLYQRLVSR
ncbi:MAG: bacterial transcriptional activator domain-containing protein [Deltaproteobacteria bacterium]|nr:bacterial transcriptional activator domain-containing protein [Deltaproteobacteria bacterium]